MYRFLSNTAYRINSLKEEALCNKNIGDRKRINNQRESHNFKTRKIEPSARAFVSTLQTACLICRSENHRERMCPTYTNAAIPLRWELDLNYAKIACVFMTVTAHREGAKYARDSITQRCTMQSSLSNRRACHFVDRQTQRTPYRRQNPNLHD